MCEEFGSPTGNPRDRWEYSDSTGPLALVKSEPQEANDFVRKPNVEPSVHRTRLAMKRSVKFARVPKRPHFMLNLYQNTHSVQTTNRWQVHYANYSHITDLLVYKDIMILYIAHSQANMQNHQ